MREVREGLRNCGHPRSSHYIRRSDGKMVCSRCKMPCSCKLVSSKRKSE